jgi:hypothetical protein
MYSNGNAIYASVHNLFNGVLSVSDIERGMNNEFGTLLQNAVVTYFKILSRYLSEGTTQTQ